MSAGFSVGFVGAGVAGSGFGCGGDGFFAGFFGAVFAGFFAGSSGDVVEAGFVVGSDVAVPCPE